MSKLWNLFVFEKHILTFVPKNIPPMNAVLIVLPILTLLMFELGLECNIDAFKTLIKNPKSVAIGVVGQVVIMPLLAFVLGVAFNLSPLYFIGLLLIASSPGGSSSNVFSMLAGGNISLSVTLTALSSVITLITLPIIMHVVIGYADSNMDATIHLPVGKLLIQNIVLVFVPFVLGVFFRTKYIKLSSRIAAVLRKVSFPALVLLATIFFVQNWQVIKNEIPRVGVVVFLFIVCAMICSGLLSRISKLNSADRRTIVIEVGMQNAAQAIAVATSPLILNNDIIAIPAIVYALFMNLILLSYLVLLRNIKIKTL